MCYTVKEKKSLIWKRVELQDSGNQKIEKEIKVATRTTRRMVLIWVQDDTT